MLGATKAGDGVMRRRGVSLRVRCRASCELHVRGGG